MEQITKKYKNKAIIFTILSYFLCFGLAIIMISITIAKYSNPSPELMEELTKKFGTVAMEYAKKIVNICVTSLIAVLPMLALAIIAKNKIRPLLWMANVILSNVLFGSAMMYITFAIWVVDEYIIFTIAKSMRTKYSIHKEIDKRE